MATTAARSAISLLWALDARTVIKRLIVERREQLGLTQEGVAELARVPLRSYQRWEAGDVLPRRPARTKLTTALQLEPGALEPPADVKDPESEQDVYAALEEVLARLTRIEAALAPNGSTPSDEKAAALAADEARRSREQTPASDTRARGGRRGSRAD